MSSVIVIKTVGFHGLQKWERTIQTWETTANF